MTQLLVLSEATTEGAVSLNGFVVVVVEDNPSVPGYRWGYELTFGTSGTLDPLNEVFVPGESMPDGPGVRVFLFVAELQGNAEVTFTLHPSGVTPERRFVCQIEIGPES